MPHLFEPLRLRDFTLANRILVSPMCQYSSVDGFCQRLALRPPGQPRRRRRRAGVHRGVGGHRRGAHQPAGSRDLGRRARRRRSRGSSASSTARGAPPASSWRTPAARAARSGRGTGTGVAPEDGGWQPVGPTERAVRRRISGAARADAAPRCRGDRRRVPRRARAARSTAGFDVVEMHARARLSDPRVPLAAVEPRAPTVRRIVRQPHPPLPRGRRCGPRGLAGAAAAVRADLRAPTGRRAAGTSSSRSSWRGGCASTASTWSTARRGGNVAHAQIPVGPGYQVPFAAQIKREADIATGAVGLITTPAQADEIVRAATPTACCWRASCCAIRYLPLRAARELGIACRGRRSICAPPRRAPRCALTRIGMWDWESGWHRPSADSESQAANPGTEYDRACARSSSKTTRRSRTSCRVVCAKRGSAWTAPPTARRGSSWRARSHTTSRSST